MIVILMGYMGCGKSTIGKKLATSLNYSFLDLDDYISENENASISELFKTKGEIYFRKKETYYLTEVIDNSENLVLALGGGTPCYGKNLELLLNNSDVKLFHLKLSIPLLSKRLFQEREKRPLISHINSEEELTEYVGKHIFERNYYYNKAHYTIVTDNKSPQGLLEEIVLQLV